MNGYWVLLVYCSPASIFSCVTYLGETRHGAEDGEGAVGEDEVFLHVDNDQCVLHVELYIQSMGTFPKKKKRWGEAQGPGMAKEGAARR